MIIETDFPDHWKTQKLIDVCGDKAVMCLLRLWLHCQLRKMWKFKTYSTIKIEAICRWNGEHGLFCKTLIEVGFLDVIGDDLVVHDFEDFNSKMCKNWKNGQKGGRPKKSDKQDSDGEPTETHEEPTQNPTETQPKPKTQNAFQWDNPTETHEEPTQNPKPKTVSNGITQPKPDSKDSKDIKDSKNIPPIIPLKGGCVGFFSEELRKSDCVEGFDFDMLVDEFSTFARYRREVCKKPIKPKTGMRHARRVVSRLKEGLTPSQIIQMFEKAMDSDWQGWDFDSEAQRVKFFADGKNAKNKNTPPEDVSQSIGSFGVPAGAFEGGIL
ncbi:MAG: hypothetical protein J6K91_05915 [Opitutales bacterium]|nr:hypothetical protein [Opitutales bacterium]